MIIGTSIAAALLTAFIGFQQVNESYAPLFTQLDKDDAAAIAAKLKEQKIAYRIDNDGSTIEVPDSKARELRLELASAGLPRGGGVGFESFDKMRLGATDFEQRVLFKRALEGELTRTIDSLGAVASSRVHIVLPEKSVFVSRGEPASASVILRLRSSRTLGSSEVASVVHLVASAVPGLDPDHISVVTTEGVMLHRPHKVNEVGDGTSYAGDEDARTATRSYESALEDRVRSMLERVVGAGHADVHVTADIDPARVERLEEHFDPSKAVLRSEEQSTEHGGGNSENSVAGIPGAESNVPGGASKSGNLTPTASSATPSASTTATPYAAASALSANSAVRESHTRNYEVDHVSEKRVIGAGAIRHLNVAVVLDGVKSENGIVPRPASELDKLTALVRSASGIVESRGDVIALESIPFSIILPETLPVAATSESSSSLNVRALRRWVPAATGVVAIAIVALAVVGVRARRSRAQQLADSVRQLAPGISEPLLATSSTQTPALDSGDLRTRAHARAAQDPATAALVLRFWLGTATSEKDSTTKS